MQYHPPSKFKFQCKVSALKDISDTFMLFDNICAVYSVSQKLPSNHAALHPSGLAPHNTQHYHQFLTTGIWRQWGQINDLIFLSHLSIQFSP